MSTLVLPGKVMYAHPGHARKGYQMRIRVTFLAGFAAGFIAGARAGRERYEQMVKLGRKAAEHPAVQKATHAAGAKATELTKTAGQKAAERMPKITETARNTARSGATKVRGQLDRRPGRRSGDDDDPGGVNGSRPAS
jgi:hypothetical protein